MNSIQYEEFCRYFLSVSLNIAIFKIKSINIPNPNRPGLPGYKHQIDLYWEDGNELVSYLNIANAKWRGQTKVDQPDVLLLQQVKTKVAAHKAVMLTNVGFTKGAASAAQDEGIALHVVQPDFDFSSLPTKDRIAIQKHVQDIALHSSFPIWKHTTHYKSLDSIVVEIPDSVQKLLARASDGELFVIQVLYRRLEYLRYVKRLIVAGVYGQREDICWATTRITH